MQTEYSELINEGFNSLEEIQLRLTTIIQSIKSTNHKTKEQQLRRQLKLISLTEVLTAFCSFRTLFSESVIIIEKLYFYRVTFNLDECDTYNFRCEI